jgi:hypothetical protein
MSILVCFLISFFTILVCFFGQLFRKYSQKCGTFSPAASAKVNVLFVSISEKTNFKTSYGNLKVQPVDGKSLRSAQLVRLCTCI